MHLSSWGGQWVSVIGFYFNDPSLNQAEVYIFCNIFVERNKIKQKEAGVGPFKKRTNMHLFRLILMFDFVPVSGQPVCREARYGVPPLVLVDVIILRVLHRVYSVLAGLNALEVGPAPATGVHPRGGVVAQAPSDPDAAGFDLQKVASAQHAPVHFSRRQNDLQFCEKQLRGFVSLQW